MINEQIIEQILTPLKETIDCTEVCATFEEEKDFIESEMMKVGSLAHGSIDWEQVEEKSVAILTECKDLTVLSALLQAMAMSDDAKVFFSSLGLLTGFIGSFWELSCPHPGKNKRALKAKAKHVCTMLKRMEEQSKKYAFTFSDVDWANEAKDYQLTELQAVLEAHEIDPDSIDIINANLKAALSQANQKVEDTPAPKKLSKTSGIDIESFSDTDLKNFFISFANQVAKEEDNSGLSFQLRRLGMWKHIQSLPPVKKGNKTELMMLPDERIQYYKDEINKGPTRTLLEEIESSLINAPFWLDGNYLSALCASRLNLPLISEAIRYETGQFVNRLEGITDLKFKDGSPFASDETQKWLIDESKSKEKSKAQPVAVGSGLEHAVMRIYKQDGLEEALQHINKQIRNSMDMRERVLLKVVEGEVLQAAGLKQIAKSHFADLTEQTQSVKLADWEPSLMKKLKQLS